MARDPPPSRPCVELIWRYLPERLLFFSVQREKVLLVPSGALFRDGLDWAVFLVKGGAAILRHVQLGPDNGVSVQVLGGLDSGDRVILYPAADVVDGIKVVKREIK